jgi:hypothetical protein
MNTKKKKVFTKRQQNKTKNGYTRKIKLKSTIRIRCERGRTIFFFVSGKKDEKSNRFFLPTLLTHTLCFEKKKKRMNFRNDTEV